MGEKGVPTAWRSTEQVACNAVNLRQSARISDQSKVSWVTNGAYLTRARRKTSWLGGKRRFVRQRGREVVAGRIAGGEGRGSSPAAPTGDMGHQIS
jgi:hypothetical protein